MNENNRPLLGVIYILAAGFLLASHDGISKYLTLLGMAVVIASGLCSAYVQCQQRVAAEAQA